jgi:5'-nucleotidase
MRRPAAPALASFVALALMLALGACSTTDSNVPRTASGPLKVKLIAFNDFHGNLQAPENLIRAPANGASPDVESKDVSVPAGGFARFATVVRQLAAQNPNHVITSSGDMIGASPLVSALFLDEPTIEAMNSLGVDFNSVGNHEFDRGIDELKRKQTGGCASYVATMKPCAAGHGFEGAKFQYLAANVIDRKTGQPIFPAYGIRTFDGVKIGFIGLTLKGTDQIVDPSGIASVEFRDEASTINARAAELKAQGVHTLVVLIHEGAFSKQRYREKACPELRGDILPILDKLDPDIDVVASAHTHQPYVCTYRNFLLTSASSYGRLVTDIDLEIDRSTGRVIRKTAVNRIVASEAYGDVTTQPGYPPVAPDPAASAQVARYVALAAPFANRAVGRATATLSKADDAGKQSPAGSVIADADLFATTKVGAKLALLNPGSVRSAIEPVNGVVSYGDLFKAEPFGNNLVTVTLSGAELKDVLEQQWLTTRQSAMILQVSEGFTYTYDDTRPMGARILAETMKLNGVPMRSDVDYRVTINSFMQSGGDGFTLFSKGRDKMTGVIDVDALEAYFGARSPIAPPPKGRVGNLNPRAAKPADD